MKNFKVKRTADKFYLKEKRHKKPLERNKFLFNLLNKNTFKKKSYNLLDVGCANGELLYQLKIRYKNFNLHGLEYNRSLFLKAKKILPKSINLYNKDFFKKNLKVTNKKFDIIIIAGVISISDYPEIVLKNLLSNLKKNGQIFIMNFFNPYPYNVFIKYVDLKSNNKFLEKGYNIFSLDFLKDFFKSRKKNLKKYPFFIKKDIKKKKDLMRSWTIKSKKLNYFTNGICILQHQYWLHIF